MATMPWLLRRAALLLLVTAPLAAQQPRPVAGQDPLTRASAAERRGADAEASALYLSVLGGQPANVQALLGAERVLHNLGKSAELIPIVQRAVALDSVTIGVLSVAVRTYARAGLAEDAERYAALWAARVGKDEDPWREWSQAALEGRDLRSARRALEEGRRRLGVGVLGADLAQLLQLSGDYAGATAQWLEVLRAAPTYRSGALILLGQAPPAQRTAVRETIQRDGSVEARRLLALLQARWGEAEAGFAALRPLLPADRAQASALLQALLDEMRGQGDQAALRVRGAVLEAIADRQDGATAVRTRLEAARAHADGGNERDARRLLALVSADADAPPGAATGASGTLLGVLIAEGKAEEAEQVLATLAPSLDLDGRDRERRRIAMAWAKMGNFDRADALVSGDSSVSGFDLRGRLRLYRGDLAGATVLLQEAGPFDDERELAVARVTVLALLQAVAKDSLPALGGALLDLERGDSARALTTLTALAQTLPPAGAAETRLLAGRLAAAQGNTAAARLLWTAADTTEAPASAPAARLALATLEAEAGRRVEALTLLERLLLEFPQSTAAPEARRLRDALRRPAPLEGVR
jgi:hypothetical protein